MVSFDFITDEGLRNCLEGDYAELKSCLETKAWKSAHVAAGSIVEAVLIDYLLSSDPKTKQNTDPLKMDLATAISICQKDGAISDKTAHLCSAIKDYRNLIHPGRSIRLGEAVDENSAKVAEALVGMVLTEISKKKKETYGYTAEQLIAKLESDPSARHIFHDLMDGMRDSELERLLLRVIPKRHAELSEEQAPNEDVLRVFERCFHNAFRMASEQIKRKAATQLLSIIKAETGDTVLWYEAAFFSAELLRYLSETDAKLVKKHILGRPRIEESETSLRLVQALEEHITPEEAKEYITVMIYFAFFATNENVKTMAADYITKPPSKMPHPSKVASAARMSHFVSVLQERGSNKEAQKLEEYQKAWTTALALETLSDAIKQLISPSQKQKEAAS